MRREEKKRDQLNTHYRCMRGRTVVVDSVADTEEDQDGSHDGGTGSQCPSHEGHHSLVPLPPFYLTAVPNLASPLSLYLDSVLRPYSFPPTTPNNASMHLGCQTPTPTLHHLRCDIDLPAGVLSLKVSTPQSTWSLGLGLGSLG